MTGDFFRALMQATGEDPDSDPSDSLQARSPVERVSPMGQVARLREAAERFTDGKVPFSVGQFVTSRPDSPINNQHGDPALVIEVFHDAERNFNNYVPELPTGYRPNMVILVLVGDFIAPVFVDAAFFEPYTGEGADL
jgi:hypothetical protein